MSAHPDSRIHTYYEWVVEQVDEYGDIHDTQAWDTLAQAQRAMNYPIDAGFHYELCLTRNTGSNAEGLQDLQWAYVEDGILPDEFDGGARVPQIYRREFAAASSVTA